MKLPKQISIKQYCLSILLVVIVSVAGILYAWGQTPTQTHWISGGIYPSANAFSVWRDGSNYFSKNNFGQLSSVSGTNFSEVFLDVLDRSSDGDTIFVARGAYQVNNMIAINKRVLIRGEGIYATTFYSMVNIPAIFLANVSYITFDNLRIDGYGDVDPDCGLSINATRCTLRNVMVISFPQQTGVKVFSWLAVFDRCTILNCFIGVEFGDNNANSVVFLGGSLYTNRPNGFLFFVAGGDTLAVYGTDFEGLLASTTAVYVTKSVGAKTRMRFIGARFETLQSAINYTGDFDHQGEDVFVACSFATSITTELVNFPSDSFIYQSPDLLTSKAGTIEANNDFWIPFNITFDATPQTILLTVQESDAQYFAQVKAKNTTHFQLYLYDHTAGALETTNKTISWYAEFQPS